MAHISIHVIQIEAVMKYFSNIMPSTHLLQTYMHKAGHVDHLLSYNYIPKDYLLDYFSKPMKLTKV